MLVVLLLLLVRIGREGWDASRAGLRHWRLLLRTLPHVGERGPGLAPQHLCPLLSRKGCRRRLLPEARAAVLVDGHAQGLEDTATRGARLLLRRLVGQEDDGPGRPAASREGATANGSDDGLLVQGELLRQAGLEALQEVLQIRPRGGLGVPVQHAALHRDDERQGQSSRALLFVLSFALGAQDAEVQSVQATHSAVTTLPL